MKIKDNLTEPSSFEFKPIKEEFISKEINELNLKKAKGRDGISTKNLKLAQTTAYKEFPDDAKRQYLPNYIRKTAV